MSVEVCRLPTNQISFHLKNISCSDLDEYFLFGYIHFKHQLESILLRRYCVKVQIAFSGLFGECREDQYREIEHYFDYRTDDNWIHNISAIDDYYNSYTAGVYRGIVNSLGAIGVHNYTFETFVFISDLDDILD